MAVLNPPGSAKKKFLERAMGRVQNMINKEEKTEREGGGAMKPHIFASRDPMLGLEINSRDSLKQNLTFDKCGDKKE
jgi:hypothetical protein